MSNIRLDVINSCQYNWILTININDWNGEWSALLWLIRVKKEQFVIHKKSSLGVINAAEIIRYEIS